MAVKQLLITSLVLCYLIQYVACFCNVTCTTDYMTSLNCSCSGTVPSSPILLEAECRDFDGQVNASCEITPSQRWCIIQPEGFGIYIGSDTTCTARVKHTGKEDKMKTNDSTDWKLYQLVKPQHPVNVQVTENIDSYNITWQMDENTYLDKLFMYRVRIRTKHYLKDPVYYPVREDRRYQVLNNLILQPGTEYVANVQASVNPVSNYQGPWSEWSSTVEWRTTEGDDKFWWQWPVLLTIVPCLILCCLCYLFKILWPKRLHLMNYSPSPEDFFKPLYHTYGGDFKKWVGPVFIFSELDPLEKNPSTQMMTEKQLDILGLSRLSVEEDSSSSGDQGTCHSAGHISIDTVMVSGEEGALSGSSWETYKCSQGGGSFSQYTGGSRGGMDSEVEGPLGAGAEEEGGLCGESGRRASTGLPAMEWQLQLQARNNQPEQISLVSEDGYPPMMLDLDSVDTIDSGVFVESDCSSPVNTNFDSEEQIDSALLSGVGSSPSEYVKQWMTGNTMQEDPTNSGQNRTM
ncbi:interleukin-21 receptor isoform X2 [Coregonus clupeaformis]|uniref:interleukin-21 receptor isoform X2 n=1 Tax=Coregonus clupeaformis TaxID=59861 RepID=UPI001BE0A0B5|nr:interleukin-21 receptor isoform X2 [Coregonus clupeaformis]